MSIIRSDRSDRRRRSMREAVATDGAVAVESARARTRRRAVNSDDDEKPIAKRDPGYSQEVRYACQQRLVSLIPVKKSTMASLTSVLVCAWAALLLLHYLINIRSSSLSGTHLAHFFHVRSPYSICHWIGIQLWMFTGIASLLIYQLRRHKLDDYRAKYRIWLFLAGAAFFSSFDASTSALQIIGYTIDPWTQRQFSLPGWPVVLSGFASIVGVLGLRLCTELKSSPGSVTLWLFGLTSWAFSAVLGTGLFKIDWSASTIDLTVGATWLGGIICVFMAAATYLRYTYIQAQKRFALRKKWLAAHQKWKVPKLSLKHIDPRRMAQGLKSKLRRKPRDVAVSVSIPSLPREADDEIGDVKPKFSTSSAPQQFVRNEQTRNEANRNVSSSSNEQLKKSNAREDVDRKERSDEKEATAAKKSKSWMPWKRNRNEEDSDTEYSDVGEQVRARDRGLISGYEKVSSNTAQAKSEQPATEKTAAKTTTPSTKTSLKSKLGSSVGGLWKRKPGAAGTATVAKSSATGSSSGSAADAAEGTESKRSWSMGMFKRSKKTAKTTSATSGTAKTPANKDSETGEKKKSLFSRMSRPKTAAADKPKTTPTADTKPKTKKPFKMFGFLDGLSLKPPTTTDAGTTAKPTASSSAPPVSSNNNASRPPAQAANTSNQSSSQNYDDDDDDASDNRNLSRAERKKLRRQNRAA